MKKRYFSAIGICAGLAGFLCIGFFLEKGRILTKSQNIFHRQEVSTGILNYGALGKILKEQGLVLAVPNDSYSSSPSSNIAGDFNRNIFKKKRMITSRLYRANPKGYSGFPSSRIMAGKKLKNDWPVLSISVNKEYLYDEKTGIFANFEKRGQKWEKLAYISYFKNKELIFSSGVGLRLHGGASRKLGRHYRLHFREDYGANQFKPGTLFSSDTEPIKRLVVHYDWPDDTPFTSCMAFDIARRIGCIVPEIQPVLLYFNGNPKGIYFLSEHVSRKQWESHLKHDRFLFKRYRGDSNEETLNAFKNLESWSRDKSFKMTREEAAKYVDIDNLTRNLISYAFCATDDWNQGTAVLEKGEKNGRWFWINWDMDRSFWVHNYIRWNALQGKTWKKQVFDLIIDPEYTEVRSVVLKRLLEEDPKYTEYFIHLLNDLLNHRINYKFLNSRLNYYSKLAISYKKNLIKPLNEFREFMRNRPGFIREEMKRYFGLNKCYLCSVTAPEDVRLMIDEFNESPPYRGYYFSTFPISVKILESNGQVFKYWLVNGEKIKGKELKLTVKSRTKIQAVFH